MRGLWEILLGLDPAPWAQGSRWRLEWAGLPRGDMAFLALIVLGIAAWVVWRVYRGEAQRVTAGSRWSLTVLRMLVLLTAAVMLFEPVIVLSRTEQNPANLLVLLDVSRSMEIKDAWVDEPHAAAVATAIGVENADALRTQNRLQLADRALREKLLPELSADGKRVVHLHTFADRLNDTTLTLKETPASTGQSTALGQAIRQAMLAYRGRPLAGVLLVSDGQSNNGPSPIAAAREAAGEGVPIVALAVGTAEGPRNVRLTKLEADPVVFIRDTNRVTAFVEARSTAEAPATVTLEQRRDGGPWRILAEKQVTLGIEGRLLPVTFDYTEDQPGKLEFRAKVSIEGAESTTDDNVAIGETRVIRPRLKVLFIAGSPFPEVQFIRNTLLRDRGIVVATWLQTAAEGYDHPGDEPIRRLPATDEELNTFDCVVLYDPDPDGWPAEFPRMLTDFVAKAGGGLVYIAGEQHTAASFDRQSDPTMGWLSLLPVVREPGLFRSQVQQRLSAEHAWSLDITPEGFRDPVFAFAADPTENRRIVENLPGMFWHFPVTRAKPGATVLARHGDPRMRNEFGPEVLLATQLVGPGRTFFLGFDSTYRWRYIGEDIFDGFWARIADRAGRNKQLGGVHPFTLATDRPTYQPGQTATITARFSDPAQIDAGLEALHAEVEQGDDPPVAIALTRGSGDGEFEATFPVTRAGPHTLRVWTGGESTRDATRPATLRFDATLPNLEMEKPTLDFAALQAAASVTGGKAFTLADLDQVAPAFTVTQVDRVLEDRQEIWDAPLLFGTIFLALVAEWLLRKRHRLI